MEATHRLALSVGAFGLVVACSLLLPISATGQATSGGSKPASEVARPWTPPQTSDGQPDLQGHWLARGVSTTPKSLENMGDGILELQKKYYAQGGNGPTSANAKPIDDYAVKGAYRTDVFFEEKPPSTLPVGIVDPPDGQVPLQPWASAKRADIRRLADEPPKDRLIEVLGPDQACLPGVPFPMNNATPYNGLQFLQYRGYVLMIQEWNHLYRFIPLDGRPHVSSSIRSWMGDSRGRWEGNTLVVDVTNFNGRGSFDGNSGGTFQTDALHLVERFTILDADTIAYEVTVEDPKMFTRPWRMAGSFHRAAKGYELFEYACHEGNRRMLNLMTTRK